MVQGSLNYKSVKFDYTLEKNNLLKLIPKENQESTFKEIFLEKIGESGYREKDNLFDDNYLKGTIFNKNQTIIMFPKYKEIRAIFFPLSLIVEIKHIIYINTDKPISRMSISCEELNAICNKRDFEYIPEINNFFDFTIKNKKIRCNVEITKNTSKKVKGDLEKIKTSMILSFDPTNDYTLLVDLYNIIKRFFQYICYRRNITINRINIYIPTEKSKYKKIGRFEINKNAFKENITVLKRFIPLECIENCMSKIFQALADDELYMRHIPETYADGDHINEASFIMITAAFEWEFKKLYVNGIPDSPKLESAKKEVEKNINNLIADSSGKEKNIYKTLLKFISLNGLAINMKYTFDRLNNIIFPFGKKIYELNNKGLTSENIDYKKMGERLAEQRNNFAHGNLDKEFDEDTLIDLIFLREIIYAMQLKRFGVTEINIKVALNNLFNAGINLS